MIDQSTMIASAGPISDLEVDLLVLPTWAGDDLSDFPGLIEASGGALQSARLRGEWSGKAYTSCLVDLNLSEWRASRLLLIGAGDGVISTGQVRRLATTATLTGRSRRVSSLAFCLRGQLEKAEAGQAAAEGLTLGEFDVGTYKTEGDKHTLQEFIVNSSRGIDGELESAVKRGRLLGECSNEARALANEPGNSLTPTIFSERAHSLAEGTNLGVEVLGPTEMEELGLGMLLGVARGSAESPKLIVMHHRPKGAPKAPVLGLVGKGITFDSGGISLKPAESMERMKDDMAGGAAVLCAMRAIDQLNVPIHVIGIVPATENLPGGRAIKPGDVLQSAAGKTVEIINTDAEGRLVLGDALWYAKRCGATHLVDVATLTGGCIVALGTITSGLFGTPGVWVDAVKRAAEVAGDQVWELPVFDEYKQQIDSEIADVKNAAGREASAITAAMFLKVFAGDTPWAHLDIAGTAWIDVARPYQAKGPSGVAVRTLVELACASETWATG